MGAQVRDFGVKESYNIKAKKNGYQLTQIRPWYSHGAKLFDASVFLEFGKNMVIGLAKYFGISVTEIDFADFRTGLHVPLDFFIDK